MPYIKKEKRGYVLDKNSTAGDLNYLFTQLVLTYLGNKGECYQTYNDIVGALDGCKLELYRRKIAPYEDVKIQENGDVY